MKKLKLIVSFLAEADIKQNAIYIARDKKDVATRFLDNFWETCELLQEMPKIGKSVIENFSGINELIEDARSWQVKNFPNYLIFYKIDKNKIIILRILNSSRDFSNIFNK